MDLKNLPITPLPSVKLDKHQEDLLLHNELFSNLLGETIFRYAGLHIYEVTEKLKEASSKYYKTQKQEARKNLSSFCSDLTDVEILRVIRSFSIFSALANIAEDVYQTHEQRYAKISNKLQIGSLEKSLKNLKSKGIRGLSKGYGKSFDYSSINCTSDSSTKKKYFGFDKKINGYSR